jgi:hypothetical protein
LSGRIDRLDVAQIDGQASPVFRLQTTKAARRSVVAVHHGLNVLFRLPAALSPCRSEVDRVAGAFCMPIEQAPDTASNEELAQRTRRRPAGPGLSTRYAAHSIRRKFLLEPALNSR